METDKSSNIQGLNLCCDWPISARGQPKSDICGRPIYLYPQALSNYLRYFDVYLLKILAHFLFTLFYHRICNPFDKFIRI